MVLAVNAILGIILLFLLNFLHGYDFATILISVIVGVPGICILVLLDILGITL